MDKCKQTIPDAAELLRLAEEKVASHISELQTLTGDQDAKRLRMR